MMNRIPGKIRRIVNHQSFKSSSYFRKFNVVMDRSDFAQEMYCKILQEGHWKDDAPVKTLYGICYFAAKNSVRSLFLRRNQRETRLDESRQVLDSCLVDCDSLILAKYALRCLNSEERALVVAHFYDGLSFSEISRNLGVTPAAVSKRMKSILIKMKKAIDN
jgi:RNA polymerase sigma factor (sigma-70 family)